VPRVRHDPERGALAQRRGEHLVESDLHIVLVRGDQQKLGRSGLAHGSQQRLGWVLARDKLDSRVHHAGGEIAVERALRLQGPQLGDAALGRAVSNDGPDLRVCRRRAEQHLGAQRKPQRADQVACFALAQESDRCANVARALPAEAVGRAAALAVPAHVQREDAVPVFGQHDRVIAHALARAARAVQQDDRRAVGGWCVPRLEGDAILRRQLDFLEPCRGRADRLLVGEDDDDGEYDRHDEI